MLMMALLAAALIFSAWHGDDEAVATVCIMIIGGLLLGAIRLGRFLEKRKLAKTGHQASTEQWSIHKQGLDN
jgi:NhaP-type Na+/H+ or K+/H+ antiporter